jgi:hypothetical protein
MPKICRKLRKLRTSEKLQLRNCGVTIAEQHSLKSYGIAIADVLPSSCGVAIADSKKSCACPPLVPCDGDKTLLAIYSATFLQSMTSVATNYQANIFSMILFSSSRNTQIQYLPLPHSFCFFCIHFVYLTHFSCIFSLSTLKFSPFSCSPCHMFRPI